MEAAAVYKSLLEIEIGIEIPGQERPSSLTSLVNWLFQSPVQSQ